MAYVVLDHLSAADACSDPEITPSGGVTQGAAERKKAHAARGPHLEHASPMPQLFAASLIDL